MSALDDYTALARIIDHSALHPTLTDADLAKAIGIAKAYGAAAICIKPYAVPLAAAGLRGSGVQVCTVIGFPHGSSAIGVKVAETERACLDGASEIDMVTNIGKVLSADWGYIAAELAEVNAMAKRHGAIVKVIFENDFLDQHHIVQLCHLCTEAGIAFVKTSSGFGFVKQASGDYNYKGATLEHLALMVASVGPGVQVKAAGGVRTLDELIKVRDLGVTRVGATATAVMMDAWRQRLGLPVIGAAQAAVAGGY